MADIYYKSGNSWLSLANNPYNVGTYVLTQNEVSPAEKVGGTWKKMTTNINLNIENISNGLVTFFNLSQNRSQVTGTISLSTSKSINLASSEYELLTGLPAPTTSPQRIGRVQGSDGLVTRSSTVTLDSSGRVYIEPNSSSSFKLFTSSLNIDYTAANPIPHIETINYIWLKVA